MKTGRVRLMTTALLVLVTALVLAETGGGAQARPAAAQAPTHPWLVSYRIDASAQGVMEKVDNIYNTTIVSKHRNVFRAEYEAGFIQGKLQGEQIVAARDNSWDSAYLLDPNHAYPQQIPPSPAEIAMAQRKLAANWEYTMEYIRTTDDSEVARNLRRLMYRLVGIYHGATLQRPQALPFNAGWAPSFSAAELALGYETPTLTFMDVYFVNAYADVLYLLPDTALPAQVADGRPSKCSAFVLKKGGAIFLTHNLSLIHISEPTRPY